MKRILISLTFILISKIAGAQTIATTNSILQWQESGPDLPTVQAITYKYYPDSAATGIVLTPVTCTGTVSPFTCQTPLPAFTAANHSIVLTAGETVNGTLVESLPSVPLAFTFVVIPATPVNVIIIKKP